METTEVFNTPGICLLTEAKAHRFCSTLVVDIISANKKRNLRAVDFKEKCDSANTFLEQCLLNEMSAPGEGTVSRRLIVYKKGFLCALTGLHQACMAGDSSVVDKRLQKLIIATYLTEGRFYDR